MPSPRQRPSTTNNDAKATATTSTSTSARLQSAAGTAVAAAAVLIVAVAEVVAAAATGAAVATAAASEPGKPMALLTAGRLLTPAARLLPAAHASSTAAAMRARRLSSLLLGAHTERPPLPQPTSLSTFSGPYPWAAQRRPLTALAAGAAGAAGEAGDSGGATTGRGRRRMTAASAAATPGAKGAGRKKPTGAATGGAKRGKSTTSRSTTTAALGVDGEVAALAAASSTRAAGGKATGAAVVSVGATNSSCGDAPAEVAAVEEGETDDAIARALARLQLDGAKGALHPYWHKRLAGLVRPAARALIPQLTTENALGFDVTASGLGNGAAAAGPRRVGGTLFDFVLAQKKAHPDKVILTRVGDFYEAWGVDALALIEYAGLNPMGNKAKAGCPYRNVQATLDGLTSAGLTVAVLEELSELDAGPSKGPGKQRLKTRVLAQVVSPGASTYLYDCCLRPDDVEFKENRPYVGLLRVPSGGFTLVEAYLDAKTLKVTERMTPEAVRVALQAGGIAEPVYTQGIDAELLRALLPRDGEVERRELQGFGNENFHQAVVQSLARELEMPHLNDDMRLIRAPPLEARPRPVYLSTALQIGLLPNPNVPDLVRCLLPQQHWAHSARFWRRWLLTPPPYRLADAMQDLCRQLSQSRTGPPQCRPVPVGKLVSMLSLRQCNVPLFRDLHGCVHAMLAVLQPHSPLAGLVPSLQAIVAHESGLDVPAVVLLEKGQEALEAIGDVIVLGQGQSAAMDDSPCVDGTAGLIPDHFFARNEDVFRNAVRPDHPGIKDAYAAVEEAARRLCELVAEDFEPACEIVVDQINNALMMKKRPASEDGGKEFIHPTDRNRKVIPKRYTTKRVEAAIGEYLACVDDATRAVRRTLQELSDRLRAELPVLVTALHVAVVLQAAAAHVACARQKGWTLPALVEGPQNTDEGPWAMAVRGLLPYWMPRGRGVENSVDLQGIFLLTAPNMSGKSTLMRAVAVAALLGNCGLFVPCTGRGAESSTAGGQLEVSRIPRFDNVFVRTASFDVPAEGKSAFALEMDDVRVLLRDCTPKSLVLLDEIGKGTSARDGAALSGALLEALDAIPVTAVFATHLHELFDLPLATRHLTWKRMGMEEEDGGGGDVRWTYRLEDGRCADSMALHTARAYGIPDPILQRAQELGHAFDASCRPTSPAPTQNERAATAAPPTAAAKPKPALTLEGAAAVLQRVAGGYQEPSATAGAVADNGLARVAPGFDPSPALEGQACVYLLRVPAAATAEAGAAASLFYVGETESVRRRLELHRARFGPRVEAAVLPVPSKSAARTVEALAINELKHKGYPLLSDADGQRCVSL